jgi:hypothetical protein
MASQSIKKRIEKIEQLLAAQSRRQKRKTYAQRMLERDDESDASLAEFERQRAEYEALPTGEKIAHKRAQLEAWSAEWGKHQGETLPPGFVPFHVRIWHDKPGYEYHQRLIEIEILALEGASEELLRLAKDQAHEARCAHRPQAPIPTEADLAAMETPRLTRSEPARADDGSQWEPGTLVTKAPSRTAAMALDHSRQNRLTEYGGHGSERQIQTEPNPCLTLK